MPPILYSISVRDQAERKAFVDAQVVAPLRVQPFLVQGQMLNLPVVRMPLELPLYRLRNGRIAVKQREYTARYGLTRPLTEQGEEDQQTQVILHAILFELSQDEKGNIFDELAKAAMQSEPLLITFYGVVVNGNRRLAAMRELYMEPGRGQPFRSFGYIEAMVLPEGLTVIDIETIEAELQMRRETKLRYGWVERRLKLREHVNDLRMPLTRVMQNWRFERQEDINRELQQVDLVDEYLTEYLGVPGQYSLVDKSEQMFTELQQAIEANPAQSDLRRLLAFPLIKEAGNLGARAYTYRRAFGDLAEPVVRRIAAERGIDLDVPDRPPPAERPARPRDEPRPSADTPVQLILQLSQQQVPTVPPAEEVPDLDLDDPLLGLDDGQPDLVDPLRPILEDPENSQDVAQQIVAVFTSLQRERRETSDRRAALRDVQEALRLLRDLNLNGNDPATFAQIVDELSAIITVATDLRPTVQAMVARAGRGRA